MHYVKHISFNAHVMPCRLTHSNYSFMSLSNDVFLPTFVFDVNYVACKLKRNSILFCNFLINVTLKLRILGIYPGSKSM